MMEQKERIVFCRCPNCEARVEAELMDKDRSMVDMTLIECSKCGNLIPICEFEELNGGES